MCVCSAIAVIENQVGVTILQHPAERDHPFNTARLARMALKNVDLRIAWEGTMDAFDLPDGAAVLYPAPDAPILGEGAAPKHLVVIDGTWPQAKALYRDSPWLHALPCVGLAPSAPSTYRIRKEPAEHCLSTIEAIHQALMRIEPDPSVLTGLLNGFDALIDGQIANAAVRVRRPRTARKRNRSTLRGDMHDRWQDVVVVYAETCPLPCEADENGVQVLQLTAFRPASGETFDAVSKVSQPPDKVLQANMGLSDEDLVSDASQHELASMWSAWKRPEDRLFAWSIRGVSFALKHLGDDSDAVHLRSMYGNVYGGKPGTPDHVVEREGLTRPVVNTRGRSAARLANAAAIAGYLADQAV